MVNKNTTITWLIQIFVGAFFVISLFFSQPSIVNGACVAKTQDQAQCSAPESYNCSNYVDVCCDDPDDCTSGLAASISDKGPAPTFNPCNWVTDVTQKVECLRCLGFDSFTDGSVPTNAEAQGIWTALGCFSYKPEMLVASILRLSTGIVGGIALLLMAYGAFTISVSTGDPKKAEEGKEIITGAIAGLLFIIFSVVLLKVIGVDILDLPGL